MDRTKSQLEYNAVRADQILFDPDSSTPIYIGFAAPGALVDEKKWQIIKLTSTAIYYADNDNSFDKVWANRASYSYGP